MTDTEILQDIGTLKWCMANGPYIPLQSFDRLRAIEERDTKGKELARANTTIEFMNLDAEACVEHLLKSMKRTAMHILRMLGTEETTGNIFFCFILRNLNNSLKVDCRAYEEKI